MAENIQNEEPDWGSPEDLPQHDIETGEPAQAVNLPQPEKLKTEEEIKEAASVAMGSAIGDFLVHRGNILSREEKQTEENPEDDKEKQAEKLARIKADIKKNSEAKKSLTAEKNIEPGREVVVLALGERAELLKKPENGFAPKDKKIIAMADGVIRGALEKTKENFPVLLTEQEIKSLEDYLAEVVKKAPNDIGSAGFNRLAIGELAEKLKELKAKLPAKVAAPQPAVPQPPKVENAPVAGIPPVAENAPPVVVEEAEEIPEKDFVEEMRQKALEEAEDRLIEKYEKSGEIPQKTKDLLGKEINSEIDGINRKFALEWIKNNIDAKGYIEGTAISVKGLDDEARVKLVFGQKEMWERALSDLKDESKDYEKYRDSLGKHVDLAAGLNEEHVPVETQYLLIAGCATLIKKKKLEVEIMQANKENSDLISAKNKEIEELIGAQKELIEKRTGKSLDSQADKELIGAGVPWIPIAKAEYVKSILDSNLQAQVNGYTQDKLNAKYEELINGSNLSAKQKAELKLSGITNVAVWPKNLELSREDVAIAITMGFDPNKLRKKGWLPFSKKITVGGVVVAENDADFDAKIAEAKRKYIEETLRSEITKTAEEAFEKINANYDEKKKEEIQREIEGFVRTSARAEGGIAEMYERLKNRLVAEYLQEAVIKEKTPQEIKKIKEKFKSAGSRKANLENIVGAIYNRTAKGFDKLDGENMDEDAETISKFFGGYGVKMSAKSLKKSMNPEEYKKAVKKKKGLVSYLLKILAA